MQCFRPFFFTVLVIFTFFDIVKNAFLKTPSPFQHFNISTKQNFVSNKKFPVNAHKVWYIWNLKYFFFLNFHFFKTVIFGYSLFLAKKHPQITKVVQRMVKIFNLHYYLSHFIKKFPLFDVDLFSWTFDMESP